MNLADLINNYSKYAISAHNVQPFVFKKINTDSVVVNVDRNCLLSKADPQYHDLIKSFGALFETLKIAGSQYNLVLNYAILSELSWQIDTISQKTTHHLLYPVLKKRFSYRGSNFEKNKNIQMPKKLLNLADDKKSVVASLYDDINYKFLVSEGYIEELWQWLRLSKNHPRYFIDGLNDQSLNLNFIEALGAQIIMKPKVFRFLASFGMANSLISEKSKIENTPYIIAIVGDKNLNLIEQGQRFLEGWLELTALDLYGHPLSLLVDDAKTLSECNQLFNIGEGQKIINILRCGFLKEQLNEKQPKRCRKEVIWT